MMQACCSNNLQWLPLPHSECPRRKSGTTSCHVDCSARVSPGVAQSGLRAEQRLTAYLDGLCVARDAKDLVGCQAEADLHVWPPAVSPPVVLTDVAHLQADRSEAYRSTLRQCSMLAGTAQAHVQIPALQQQRLLAHVQTPALQQQRPPALWQQAYWQQQYSSLTRLQ